MYVKMMVEVNDVESDMTFKCFLDGVMREFLVLYTFKSIKYNKDYVIYTDNLYDNKKLNVYASIYNPFCLEDGLFDIETDEEWDEIERFLEGVKGDIDG